MSHIVFYLKLVLLLLLTFPTEIHPPDIWLAVGETLILNCTIKDAYLHLGSASDMTFYYYALKLDHLVPMPDSQQKISDKTIQLQLTNVTTIQSGKYRCGLKAYQKAKNLIRPTSIVTVTCESPENQMILFNVHDNKDV